jgi:integrase
MIVQELLDRYRREVVPTMRERTQRDYARHLDKLGEVFGKLEANEVKPKDIGKFLDVAKGKIHRNRQVAVLSAVFSKAVGRWYLVDRNPCRDVERNPSRKRDRYVSDDEYRIVYNAMPVRVQVAMDLAILTGQRQGDLLGLKWDQITPQGIRFQQGKTGKKLLVGLSPALSAVLERAKRLLPDLPREYVIRTEDGQQYTPEGFRAGWQRRMRELHKSGKLPERFSFHDLRAKCVSDTENIQDAFERAGHTSMALTRGVYDRGVRKVTPLR